MCKIYKHQRKSNKLKKEEEVPEGKYPKISKHTEH